MQTVGNDTVQPANAPGEDGAVSHRARAACRVCRAKKVRCDAREGKRCSNCAFEDVQCEIVPKQPRRRMKLMPTILPRAPPDPSNSAVEVQNHLSQYAPATSNLHEPGQSLDNQIPPHDTRPEYQHNTDSAQSKDSPASAIDLPWSPGGAEHRQIYSVTARSLSPMRVPSTLRSSVRDLPAYIKPVPSHLDADDVAYLEKKDAFTLPDPELRDDCLRCYFQYMHPLYPTVDFNPIWSAVHASRPNVDKVSLLLLQALIFAGGMWADVKLVRSAGFLSRKAFRQSLTRRIRLLYDADYEDDRMVLVQSLLLWSFWFKKANDQKDGWYWVGIAHSIACTIDLQNSKPAVTCDSHTQYLRKQLWWALCNREVIGSLDLRRAPRFAIAAEDISNISPDEFEYRAAVGTAVSDLDWLSDIPSQILARLSVEYTKLTQIFGKILSLTCHQSFGGRMSISHSSPAARTPENLPLVKRQRLIEKLVACNEDLAHWRHKVPDDLWHVGTLPTRASEWLMATLSHRAALSMMYHTAVMTIHRPQALPLEMSQPSPAGTNERDRKQAARSWVRHSVQEITKIAMDFFNADVLNSLPATVVSCIMHVSIHHTFDTFSDHAPTRDQASRHLDECRAMLYTLAERQFAPSWVLQTIEYILSRAKPRARLRRDYLRSENQAADEPSGRLTAPPGQRNGDDGISSAHQPDVHSAADETQSSSLQDPPINADNPALYGPAQPSSRPMEFSTTSGPGMSGGGPYAAEWMGHFMNNGHDPWAVVPSASLMDIPFLPDAGEFGLMEDSWLDLARVSDTVTGLNWQLGSF